MMHMVIINTIGLGLIAFIVWWFWLSKAKKLDKPDQLREKS